MALNHFFDLEVSYQVASNEQDVAFFNQKKLNKELTVAQRVMRSRIIVMMMISSDHSLCHCHQIQTRFHMIWRKRMIQIIWSWRTSACHDICVLCKLQLMRCIRLMIIAVSKSMQAAERWSNEMLLWMITNEFKRVEFNSHRLGGKKKTESTGCTEVDTKRG